jgi:hypothetical protein
MQAASEPIRPHLKRNRSALKRYFGERKAFGIHECRPKKRGTDLPGRGM